MRTGMSLTIQDYFKRVKGTVAAHAPAVRKTAGDSAAGSHEFSKALESAEVSSGVKARGLSIQDYLHNRIPAHVPAVNRPIPAALQSDAHTPAPVPRTYGAEDKPAASSFPDEALKAVKQSQVDLKSQDMDRISASIARAAFRYDLPAGLIEAVVKAESNYSSKAVSPAGAQGLMQLMPATAKELGVTDPFDVDQNIDGGAQYLRKMLDQFKGDIRLALSAYNAGPGTVVRYQGDVPYAETRNYVQRVLRYAEQFSASVRI